MLQRKIFVLGGVFLCLVCFLWGTGSPDIRAAAAMQPPEIRPDTGFRAGKTGDNRELHSVSERTSNQVSNNFNQRLSITAIAMAPSPEGAETNRSTLRLIFLMLAGLVILLVVLIVVVIRILKKFKNLG